MTVGYPSSYSRYADTHRGVGYRRAIILCLFILAFLVICLMQFNIPYDFIEPWAGRDRLPYYSIEISRIYRSSLPIPPIDFGSMWEFWPLFESLHIALWSLYVLSLIFVASRINRIWLWISIVLLVLAATITPPLFSTDVFYYGISGESLALHGLNPYLTVPADLPNSPLLPFNYWIDLKAVYGPLWTSLSALVILITGNSPFSASMGFKLLGGLSVLAIAYLIWQLLRNSESRIFATALFAWNPLVLFEGPANAHLDAFVGLLVVLGLFAIYKHKSCLTGWILLVASFLTKFTTAPLLMINFVSQIKMEISRNRLKRIFLLTGAFIFLVAVTYLPYWQGKAFPAFLDRQRLFVTGFVPLLVRDQVLRYTAPFYDFDKAYYFSALASEVGVLLLILWVLLQSFVIYRDRKTCLEKEAFAWGSTMSLLPMLFLTAYPWYLIPGFALLAISWNEKYRKYIALLYAVGSFWWLWWTILMPI
ncbi:hypothetical protein Tter_1675 [Thermobaculum terrenum ATCC BAA-798]|uniref:Glycosyltransferase RgtA/B/C/D-like domain-containing protein n=2 Tax=Thermobaculum TaxID=262406 RepID=D1CCR6_THET1|nr:hypothetical protein Tter_1675 [Thermobaculum terrenum ATCC BAA-798]